MCCLPLDWLVEIIRSVDSLLKAKDRPKGVPLWNYFIIRAQVCPSSTGIRSIHRRFSVIRFPPRCSSSIFTPASRRSTPIGSTAIASEICRITGRSCLWRMLFYLHLLPGSVSIRYHRSIFFRSVVSNEFVDLHVVHVGGFLIDISVGFLLLSASTRKYAFLFCGAFNLMNSQIFTIGTFQLSLTRFSCGIFEHFIFVRSGMFPYMMIAVMPIFCAPDWPRKLVSAFGRADDVSYILSSYLSMIISIFHV